MKVKVQPKKSGTGKGRVVIKSNPPMKGKRSRHLTSK